MKLPIEWSTGFMPPARNMRRDQRILWSRRYRGSVGGAFKVTKDLSAEFPGRVRKHSPISEAAIIGVGNGLALSGRLPVCELVWRFSSFDRDQLINHASKFATSTTRK